MQVSQRVTVGEDRVARITMPEEAVGRTLDLTVLFDAEFSDGVREPRPFPYPLDQPRKAGSAKGKIHLGPEFDDPIPGMEDYV